MGQSNTKLKEPTYKSHAINVDDMSISQINKHTHDITDESLTITQNCLQELTTINNMNHDINKNLDGQTIKIKAMEKDCESIEYTIYKSNRKLRSIKSFPGAIYNKIVPNKYNTKFRNNVKATNEKWSKADNPERSRTTYSSRSKSTINNNIEDKKLKDKYDQIDDNIDKMSDLLDDIKFGSQNMQRKLEEHQDRLNNIDPFMNHISRKVDGNESKCRDILK